VQFFHAPAKTHAIFDDEHVIGYAGLAPIMRLAERCGLPVLAAEHVTAADPHRANTPAKIASILAGMVLGADSIEDLDLLRHGGMDKMFDGIRAPSTLGTFLRGKSWGGVRQIDKRNRRMLAALAPHTPLLPGAGVLAFIDVDSMQRRTYGYRKQGSGFGHTKIQGKSVLVRGLNVLLGTVSTPLAAPGPGCAAARPGPPAAPNRSCVSRSQLPATPGPPGRSSCAVTRRSTQPRPSTPVSITTRGSR
jgi:hypothetical protein